jgi:hypothetical protein
MQDQDRFFSSSEGVDILPVKPNQKANYGPHQYLCSTQGSSPVKIKHSSISRVLRTPAVCPHSLVCSCLCWRCRRRGPGPASADHRFHSRHRQPAHSQGDHPGAPVHPPRRHLRPHLHRARFQLAVEHRLLREPAHRARRLGERHHPRRFRQGKAHHPRDQLQGPQRRLAIRRARPLQEGEGRPLRREPVRPGQDSARHHRPQGDLLSEHGHQFAVIKLDIKDIPPASVQVNFNIKEGPTVKVGNIKFTGNQHLSGLCCAAP